MKQIGRVWRATEICEGIMVFKVVHTSYFEWEDSPNKILTWKKCLIRYFLGINLPLTISYLNFPLLMQCARFLFYFILSWVDNKGVFGWKWNREDEKKKKKRMKIREKIVRRGVWLEGRRGGNFCGALEFSLLARQNTISPNWGEIAR